MDHCEFNRTILITDLDDAFEGKLEDLRQNMRCVRRQSEVDTGSASFIPLEATWGKALRASNDQPMPQPFLV